MQVLFLLRYKVWVKASLKLSTDQVDRIDHISLVIILNEKPFFSDIDDGKVQTR